MTKKVHPYGTELTQNHTAGQARHRPGPTTVVELIVEVFVVDDGPVMVDTETEVGSDEEGAEAVDNGPFSDCASRFTINKLMKF